MSFSMSTKKPDKAWRSPGMSRKAGPIDAPPAPLSRPKMVPKGIITSVTKARPAREVTTTNVPRVPGAPGHEEDEAPSWTRASFLSEADTSWIESGWADMLPPRIEQVNEPLRLQWLMEMLSGIEDVRDGVLQFLDKNGTSVGTVTMISGSVAAGVIVGERVYIDDQLRAEQPALASRFAAGSNLAAGQSVPNITWQDEDRASISALRALTGRALATLSRTTFEGGSLRETALASPRPAMPTFAPLSLLLSVCRGAIARRDGPASRVFEALGADVDEAWLLSRSDGSTDLPLPVANARAGEATVATASTAAHATAALHNATAVLFEDQSYGVDILLDGTYALIAIEDHHQTTLLRLRQMSLGATLGRIETALRDETPLPTSERPDEN